MIDPKALADEFDVPEINGRFDYLLTGEECRVIFAALRAFKPVRVSDATNSRTLAEEFEAGGVIATLLVIEHTDDTEFVDDIIIAALRHECPKPALDEPTRDMMEAAVDAYVAEMDPELRGGLVRSAVHRGMWPALCAALKHVFAPDPRTEVARRLLDIVEAEARGYDPALAFHCDALLRRVRVENNG